MTLLPPAPTTDRAIDARSIVTLVIFFVVNILVLFPLRIPLPLPHWAARRLNTLRRAVGLDEHTLREGTERTASLELSTANATTNATTNATDSTPARVRERIVFTLGLATAPVAGVLLLLASTCVPGSVVRRGIVGVGHGGVRPYDIMTLFLSFAYISLSLDSTGLLLFLAFTVSQRAPPNGRALFTYLFVLFISLALLVGNDPIVLSGTPFVAYFTRHAKISPPRAFLFAEFQAANLASALLVSSNPTNLVLTSSFGFTFLQFSAWTALPTIAAAAVLYPTLMVVFRNSIPGKITKQHVVPRTALTDPFGALFTTTIFLTAIVMLVVLSALQLLEGTEGVWCVTAPAALLVFFRDAWHDWSTRGSRETPAAAEETELSSIGRRNSNVEANGNGGVDAAKTTEETQVEAIETGQAPPPDPVENGTAATLNTGIEVNPSMVRRRTHSTAAPARPVVMRRHGSGDSRALNIPPPVMPDRPSPTPTPVATSETSTIHSAQLEHNEPSPAAPRTPLARFRHTFPTLAAVIARLPLPLLPFAFSMFILVDALEYTGWVRVWAGWWTAYARAGGAAGCIVLMGVISVIGCNILGTNIGVTVLLSRILVVWREQQPTKRALYGSIFALAVGSNFGAYSFSFPASLAGLLWRDILAHKGLHVRRLEFLRWNFVPLFVTMAVGACVVGGEVCVMFKEGEK